MIDTVRSKCLNIITQLKTSWNGSLFFRIAFSFISVLLIMAALFAAVTGIAVYYSIGLKESASLKSNLDILSSNIEHRINDIASDSENLSNNTLVMNALVDTYGRDAYLIPFLKGHKVAEGIPHLVGVCDFQGNAIASNNGNSFSFKDKELLDALLAKGKPISRIEERGNSRDKHLVIFQPVKYLATGTTEGFLVVDLLLKDIFNSSSSKGSDISESLFQGNLLILGKTDSSGLSMRKKLKLAGVASGLDISAEVRTPRSPAIFWCVVAMLVITALMGRFIFRISFRISDNLTTRLVVLNEAAKRISESGVPDRKVEESGIDEIGHLADSFNRMIDQLRGSYDALESRVEERTRLLAEANRTLTEEIEQRLQAEKCLKELNENLETIIQNEIEQHREKEKMLIHQNRLASMGEMIGNIAHQWRQPLNNVGLIVQNLQMDFEFGTLTSESIKKEVGNCMESIQYMSRTIDDFRNFFSSDKEKHLFSTVRTVSRVVALVAPTLNNLGIKPNIVDDESGEILGHENEFGQVLMNLINNAKDAILERKPTDPFIEIRCFKNGERSLVTVRDNAGGIDESLMDKVFDPYFTTKFKSQGTGIGLFMSKTIIEKNMGGILSVRNTGDGAEFRIEI